MFHPVDSQAELRRAYYKRAKLLHPDIAGEVLGGKLHGSCSAQKFGKKTSMTFIAPINLHDIWLQYGYNSSYYLVIALGER